ncbi:hypothetical protein ACSFM0_001272 [Escherichia coli]|uniref:hypothetical protein n=1 Tax=Escherichia coli TaxID=562 RepID=UPI000BE47E83|nr:hypothetical protein [Escherichia coli]EES8118162.1 hypothetical protein [Escherichia coli]EFF9100755.1 hypothetical protein [Escherichia coli]EHK6137186.1 hypothetical protein [Escherichia coli]EHW6699261.1 hypothetical protein [Escherichia coli]ELT5633195.1 hypothetical protein [Escherichia coli]
MSAFIDMLTDTAARKYPTPNGNGIAYSQIGMSVKAGSDDVKAVFKRQKRVNAEVFGKVVRHLGLEKGLTAFLYDGDADAVLQAQIAELKMMIAERDAEIRELRAQLANRPETSNDNVTEPNRGEIMANGDFISEWLNQNRPKTRKQPVSEPKPFIKPLKYKPETVMEYLAAHAPVTGTNHKDLAIAIWPIGAPGKTTLIMLLKQLKDEGRITIKQRGRNGMDIFVNDLS